MISISYPDYEEQKKAHDPFIAQLAELSESYKSSGGNILLVINANKMVIDWLTKHISNMDKKIGIFAKQRG